MRVAIMDLISPVRADLVCYPRTMIEEFMLFARVCGPVLAGCAVAACAAVSSAPAPRRPAGVYFVKAGDTLSGISRLFSVDVDEHPRS